MTERKISIVFMGTPDFAVATLKAVIDSGYKVAGVVTAPDKPAGRGLKLTQSPVKQYALEKGLPVLQPSNLKSPEFEKQLDELGANLYIVVAFRMLPKSVWSKPVYGTFNLHASLLPDYRGAAPINRAIMNGESETGVTTFFINEQIDTGHILFSEKVAIAPGETAGELHDKLMDTGAGLVVKTVKAIESGHYEEKDQSSLTARPLKEAPKLFREDCKIDWQRPAREVFNLIRGLDPYPGAWSELIDKNGKTLSFKVFRCHIDPVNSQEKPSTILSDGKTIGIVTGDGEKIVIEEIQVAGKKKMSCKELLRGFPIDQYSINQ